MQREKSTYTYYSRQAPRSKSDQPPSIASAPHVRRTRPCGWLPVDSAIHESYVVASAVDANNDLPTHKTCFDVRPGTRALKPPQFLCVPSFMTDKRSWSSSAVHCPFTSPGASTLFHRWRHWTWFLDWTSLAICFQLVCAE